MALPRLKVTEFRIDIVQSEASNKSSFGELSFKTLIERHYTEDFSKQIHLSNNTATPDQDSPHIIGTTGNEMWATGQWTTTVKDPNWGPVDVKGYWTAIREGDDLKIRNLTFNVTPAPAK